MNTIVGLLYSPPKLHSWLNSGVEDLAKLELVVNSYYLRDHLALERRHIVLSCVWIYRTWRDEEWQKWEEGHSTCAGPAVCHQAPAKHIALNMLYFL